LLRGDFWVIIGERRGRSFMDKHSRVLDPQELEGAINQVRGVVANRVVPGDKGGLSEIHVMASTKRAPKQIVRDIESLLFVKFGFRVDYRKISLVQLGEEQILPLGLSRLKLISVHCKPGPVGAEAEVQIGSPEGLHVGLVQGEGVGEAELVAQATLNALQQVVGAKAELALQGVERFDLGGRKIIVVQVSFLFPAGEETLLGVSFIGGEGEREASARAALDAVNRRLPVIKLS